MMDICVNNEPRRMPEGSSLQDLADAMGLAGKRYAIELNGEVVPKARHPQTPLQNGDCLEVVVAVGGG